MAREAGKVLVEAAGDVQEAVDMGRFVAGQGRAAMGAVGAVRAARASWRGRPASPSAWSGLITPWNFPVAIPSWKCFPALLAGNGIVLKPSEQAPLCAERFVACLVEAGVPADLVNVVHGRAEPGARAGRAPGRRRRQLHRLGADRARSVAAAAMAAGPKLVSLELGGKNAMVVLPDADLDLAVDGALVRRLRHGRPALHVDVAPRRAARASPRSC